VGKTRLVSFGHVFRADTDSLRAALDSAVLSPTGWAVGVDAEGGVIGVVSQETIADAIRAAHATQAHVDVAVGDVEGEPAAEDAGPEDRSLEQAR
jgi:osmoprotectant transport system ATP-binding protein